MRLVTLAGLLLTLIPGGAWASGWVFDVGPQVGVAPPYEGANRDAIVGGPNVDLRPAGSPERFVPPDGGTTVSLVSTTHFEFGPMVRFRYDRPSTGDLTGLQHVTWAAEPGAFLDVWPTPWLRARVELRKGVTGHIGWVGDAGMDLVYNGKRWDASVGPRIGFGDARYMRTYFGVTPEEAARSPLIDQAYAPRGGERYAGVETAISYRFNRRWRATFDVGYQRLAKDPADSPIVRIAGSPDQYSSSIGLSYSFQVGGARPGR